MGSKPFVPAERLTKLWRAIIEFDMLKKGDKVLIGLSGGKDSMFLTVALAEIRRHAPFHFDLACFTVDAMFSRHFPAQELAEFCAAYGVAHFHEQVNVNEAWSQKKGNKGNTPCFTCAYFRRAATNRKAKELGFNKVALAHHHDDAVETFLLNLITSGQLKTFLPVTYLTRSAITVLRPLLYYREAEVRAYGQEIGLKPLKNPCLYDGRTKRQEIKEWLKSFDAISPEAYEHFAAAMRQSPEQELWPEKLAQKASLEKFRKFWHK